MYFKDSALLWNDVTCYMQIGGVICKRNCSETCNNENNDVTITTVETTTELLETTTNIMCENNNVCGADGWKWHCNSKKTKCYSYHKYTIPSNGSYWKVSIFCLL